MKILIVEGNDRAILNSCRDQGVPEAATQYSHALRLHAPEAEYAVACPFAPELEHGEFDVGEADAIALTGSGIVWSAGDHEARPYMTFLETVMEAGKPVIGSCWGMQTVIELFGGTSRPNKLGTEIGLAEDIELTKAGRNHWIYAGFPDRFSSPCIHRDHVVEMPEAFDLLASNPVSRVQSVSLDPSLADFVGFQFHPELPLGYIRALAERRGLFSEINDTVASFPDPETAWIADEMARTRVFANWIDHIGKTKAATQNAAA